MTKRLGHLIARLLTLALFLAGTSFVALAPTSTAARALTTATPAPTLVAPRTPLPAGATALPPLIDNVKSPAISLARTGGPYVTEQRALELARALAQAPIAREAARVLPYADVARWDGTTVNSIAGDREFYLVVLSTDYTPRAGTRATTHTCGWLAVKVDAPSGSVMGLRCGPGTWPAQLPAQFGL